MEILSGHLLQEVLYESPQTRIYRGIRLFDGLPVIVKILNQPHSSVERRARFEQKYRLMQRLQLDAVVTAYSLEREQGKLAIVMEDFGGQSLNKLAIAGKLPLDEWLRLAIHITQRLGQLHAKQVMHKDINPSNIVWNRDTGQLKLIDLGIATELAHEVAEQHHPERLEGTLPYISPEQTGRMNRAIDYRTDFYSLGVTLYELLTGQLPFAGDDALQLVHAHIARQPMSARQVKPKVPAMVSAILDKLLAKTAEERYQSAAGLVADLRTCLQTLDAHGQIPMFELGSRDFSLRLQIPQKLYGREKQVRMLLEAFGRVAGGSGQLLLVTGYAGVGKSALVHEVQKPIIQHRGYFIEGKFDQFQRDIPYRTFTQAFGKLIRQILTEPRPSIEEWKDKLLAALGNNAQVVIDVIPDLALLIGNQPAVIDLPPTQAQNRFNHEFRKFVAVFATAEHPLVVFIDDLQWADLASLELMALLCAPALPHLLLIGAYRDNEVAPGHALALVLDDMQKQGVAMRSLTLAPLAEEEVSQLLSDTLHADAVEVQELARLCLAKTGGNPFFLNQFLMTLADRDMLHPDPAYRRWQWDIERIRDAGITDNVVELMVAKLRKLSEPTQRVLQGAACLGNVFDLQTLAIVCDLSPAETAQRLWPALAEELVVPLDAQYKYAGQPPNQKEQPSTSTALNPRYRFLHDRVHQAATLLSSEVETAAMHLAIGRLWSRIYSRDEQSERLFDLVNHFNQGRNLIDSPQERYRLVELNLTAARKAKASAAYKPALNHLEIALELSDEQEWQHRYDLMFALHLDAAEAAYLSIDYERMQHYIDTGLRHARDVVDRARLQEIHILSCIAQRKSEEAVFKGLDVLRLLGVFFPKRPTELHIWLGLMKTRCALRGKSMDQLERLPNMTDRRMLAASSILQRLINASYYAVPLYYPLFAFRAIQWGLQYGYAPTAAPFYVSYGMTLRAIAGDLAQGARYADLAARLQTRPEMKSTQCRTMVLIQYMVKPWIEPLHGALDLHAYTVGIELGDLDFAGIAANGYCIFRFHCGHELAGLEDTIPGYRFATEQMQRMSDATKLRILEEGIQKLRGKSQSSACIFDTALNHQQQLQILRVQPDNHAVVFILCLMKMIVHYHLRQHEAALENAMLAEKYIIHNYGSYNVSLINFYGSLIRLVLAGKSSTATRRAMLLRVKRNQRKMRHWADHAPANFLHKWHLVEAELARIAGNMLMAIEHFERAIALARENGFLQEQALAQELAGQFHLSRGQQSMAKAHLSDAWQSYRRWGAAAKVRGLENSYPWLVEQDYAPLPAATATITTSSTAAGADALDWAAAMKASQALSQEIVLDKLLRRLMDVVLEHAGAQRGMLLLRKGNNWYIEAEKSEEQPQAMVLQSILLDESQADALPLPISLVRYVSRTRENIVIHEAADNEMTAGDLYVRQYHPRSLLMLPVLHQAELIGMLYLENNAASGVFTETRLEALQLLAAQVTISMENARIYANMEQRMAERDVAA